ncbi:hypothetical protein [Thiolapillus sp.]
MKYTKPLLSLLAIVGIGTVHAKGSLENPKPGDYTSGISTIYGWNCDASLIEIQIDNGGRIKVPYGSQRADTESTCGDTDNGFVTQYNFGLLKNGEHRIRLYVDGVEQNDRTFHVSNLGAPYIRGLKGSVLVPAFPDDAHDTTLTWSESTQNFQISKVEPSGNYPSPDFNGIWRVENSVGDVLFQTTAGYIDGKPWLTVSMLDLDYNDLQIFSGQIEGKTATVDDEYSSFDTAFEMKLINSSKMEMTVLHCKPSTSCNIRAGEIYTLLRQDGREEK